eukprot:scaffold404913_cov32-Prasinocladus_malaysianus.AAC.1
MPETLRCVRPSRKPRACRPPAPRGSLMVGWPPNSSRRSAGNSDWIDTNTNRQQQSDASLSLAL